MRALSQRLISNLSVAEVLFEANLEVERCVLL